MQLFNFIRAGAALVIAVGLTAGVTSADTDPAAKTNPVANSWTQWRGPTRDGRIATAAQWPDRLDESTLRQTWRVPLAPSYSGPIVTESLVFVTETKDRAREVVRALDRKTGEQRWEQSWEGSLTVPFFAKENGDWIRATPAFDGECLYVGGIRDVLVCLDGQTGAIRWQKDFVKELGTQVPSFGFVSSPLIDGDDLYVQAAASCVKLNKKTGEVVWRTLKDAGGMSFSAFSSPYLTTLAGRKQLLVQTRELLAGVDPEGGEVLWSQKIPSFQNMNILTPIVIGENVFTSAYKGKSYLFRVEAKDGACSLTEAWTNKASGYMSSPVVIDGHLYLHLQNQRFTCIDLATGETRWTTKPYGKYWSMVTNGQNILALDERGELLLIRANPERFELVDSRKVSEEDTWAHLAVCGDEVFVRELNAMTAFRWRKPADAPPQSP